MTPGFLATSFDPKEITGWARRHKVRLPIIRQLIYDNLERVSLQMMNQVKQEMPKDTWRATRSWGKDSGFGGDASNPFDPEDPIWDTNWRGPRHRYDQLYIYQGTDTPYVEALNEGSSTQAPAGFIDAIFEEGSGDLEAALVMAMVDELFE